MPKNIDAVKLSQLLIKCASVTPTDNGAQTILRDVLKEIGFTCYLKTFSDTNTPDVQNLYARIGKSSPNLCFAGHTDVVPVGDPSAWTENPFGGKVVNGMLYGRGASDMKTAIACFVSATSKFIQKRGSSFDGSISFLITGDEEGPAINGTKKLLKWAYEEGQTFDACIVGEPTNPTKLGEMIKIGRRGSLNGRLVVNGIQGHTAYPHLADNPIHKLVQMLDVLSKMEFDKGSEHFQASTLQISTIDVGNQATNVIPSSAAAVFNIRFNDLHSSTSLTEILKEKLDSIDKNYNLEVSVSGESFITPPGELSTIISKSAKSITGLTPELSTTGGTSDARFIKDYCPVAEFGLIGQTMHKPDECVSVKDVKTLTEVYSAILENYFPINA